MADLNPRIQITENWDGTANLTVDGDLVMERKSVEEVKEKAKHVDVYLALYGLTPETPSI